jgi:UDP-xylose/UDP-N-acetylglucosamine transporter B4
VYANDVPRFSKLQVLSVTILTVGVTIAAMADSKSKTASPASYSSFLKGLSILFVAQILSAFMGLYVQTTYERYGSHWRENLFYSHVISLLFFIPFFPSMKQQLQILAQSESVTFPPSLLSLLPTAKPIHVPRQILNLGLNAVTQYLCIRGVNLLGAQTSALTITIVLNVRKLVSLILSMWMFGNTLNTGVMSGAGLVFLAGAGYALESSRLARLRRKQKSA